MWVVPQGGEGGEGEMVAEIVATVEMIGVEGMMVVVVDGDSGLGSCVGLSFLCIQVPPRRDMFFILYFPLSGNLYDIHADRTRPPVILLRGYDTAMPMLAFLQLTAEHAKR